MMRGGGGFLVVLRPKPPPLIIIDWAKGGVRARGWPRPKGVSPGQGNVEGSIQGNAEGEGRAESSFVHPQRRLDCVAGRASIPS